MTAGMVAARVMSFREEQEFRALGVVGWLLVFATALTAAVLVADVVEALMREAQEGAGGSVLLDAGVLGRWLGLATVLAAEVVVVWFVWGLRLETRVGGGVVRLCKGPLRAWEFSLADVEGCEVSGPAQGRCVRVWGSLEVSKEVHFYTGRTDRAVKVRLRDGGQVLIGSRQPERLRAAILAGGR